MPPTTLPVDLREWLEERELVTHTLVAVQEVPWSGPHLSWAGGAGASFSPRMLLTLLTYCYACGVDASREVEWLARHDGTVGYLCAGQCPDWNTVRRFRRDFRGTLRRSLADLLARAWPPRHKPLLDSRPSRMESDFATSSVRWAQILERPDFEAAAEERIRAAIQADSMAMDE